jgi:ABC-type transporter Mla subunit MlaD
MMMNPEAMRLVDDQVSLNRRLVELSSSSGQVRDVEERLHKLLSNAHDAAGSAREALRHLSPLLIALREAAERTGTRLDQATIDILDLAAILLDQRPVAPGVH